MPPAKKRKRVSSDNRKQVKRSESRSRAISCRPDSYALLPGCHSCKHCFIRHEYEEQDEYYCTFKAPKRPKSGSVAMKEAGTLSISAGGIRRGAKLVAKWRAWSAGRDVRPWGYCAEHHPSEKDDTENLSLAVTTLRLPFKVQSETLASSRTMTFFIDMSQSVRSKKG